MDRYTSNLVEEATEGLSDFLGGLKSASASSSPCATPRAMTAVTALDGTGANGEEEEEQDLDSPTKRMRSEAANALEASLLPPYIPGLTMPAGLMMDEEGDDVQAMPAGLLDEGEMSPTLGECAWLVDEK